MRSVHTATVRVLVAERLMHRLTALGMAVGSATLQWVTAGAVACSTPSLLRAKWDAARTQWGRSRHVDRRTRTLRAQWRCSGDAVGIQTCEPPTTLHCARSTHSAVGPAVKTCDYVLTTGSCGRQLRQVSCGRSGGVVETQSALLDFQPTAGVAALTQSYLQSHNVTTSPLRALQLL
jgi:hypothetical protein